MKIKSILASLSRNREKKKGKDEKNLAVESEKDQTFIVVAYRDQGDGYRKNQLDIFVEQINLIFKDITDYHIYLIEQESDRENYDELPEELKQKGTKMAKFNLGILKNIGFKLANDKSKDIENSYYVLSDVDLLPSNELLEDYLKYPETPIHLGNRGTRYTGNAENFLGGVFFLNISSCL